MIGGEDFFLKCLVFLTSQGGNFALRGKGPFLAGIVRVGNNLYDWTYLEVTDMWKTVAAADWR